MAYLGLESIRRGNTSACIQDIFTLHFKNAKTVLDCTYGAGRFWNWNHSLAVTGVDIDPPGPVSVVADYRSLPFPAGSFDVMCFDPPFIFSKGLRRVIGTKRFFMGAEAAAPSDRTHSATSLQLPKNPVDLLQHYRRIFEQCGIARHGLILKGQDLIVNKPDWWCFNVMDMADNMGLGMPADILIQQSPAPRMRDPRWKNQYHFRRAHCYYIIYKW
jgi:hypothetical protein